MANTIAGGSQATPVSGVKTLGQLVTDWRNYLDDALTPYLWSNNELTSYANDIINELCVEVPLIEDSSTASICQHAIAIDQSTVTLSDRIVAVRSARLTSQTKPLLKMSVNALDSYVSDWRDADSGSPEVFATDGVGGTTAILYPPSDSTDTLVLTVHRLPQADLVYDTDNGSATEVPPRFVGYLVWGILSRAYAKQDADTYDSKKMADNLEKWQNAKEQIRRALIKYRQFEDTVTPKLGFM